MKRAILICAVIMVPVFSAAQPPMMMGLQDRKGMQEGMGRREKVEMMRIWKLTEELQLTEEQSMKFFPRLKGADREIEELDKKKDEIFRELHELVESGNVKKSDVDESIKRLEELDYSLIKRQRELIDGLDEVLTPEQKAKYVIFRRNFRDRMMQMMNEMRQNRRMDMQMRPRGERR